MWRACALPASCRKRGGLFCMAGGWRAWAGAQGGAASGCGRGRVRGVARRRAVARRVDVGNSPDDATKLQQRESWCGRAAVMRNGEKTRGVRRAANGTTGLTRGCGKKQRVDGSSFEAKLRGRVLKNMRMCRLSAGVWRDLPECLRKCRYCEPKGSFAAVCSQKSCRFAAIFVA
jgi:hypothetical protein